jgi:hypothetical protein
VSTNGLKIGLSSFTLAEAAVLPDGGLSDCRFASQTGFFEDAVIAGFNIHDSCPDA